MSASGLSLGDDIRGASTVRLISTVALEENAISQPYAAMELATRGDAAIDALLSAFDPDELDEEALGRLTWVLINSAGDPNEELVERLRSVAPSVSEQLPAAIDQSTAAKGDAEFEGGGWYLDMSVLLLRILVERGTRSLPALDALLIDREERLRRLGLTLATDLGVVASPSLQRVSALALSGSPSERRLAIGALSAIGFDGRSQLFKWLTGNASVEVRRLVAASLQPAAELIPALAWASRWDRDRSVRHAAASTIHDYLESAAPGSVPAASIGPLLKSLRSIGRDSPAALVSLVTSIDPRSPELDALKPQLLALAHSYGDAEEDSEQADALESLARMLNQMPASEARGSLLSLSHEFIARGWVEGALIVLEAIQESEIPFVASETLIAELVQRLPADGLPDQAGRLADLAPSSATVAAAIVNQIAALRGRPVREGVSREHEYRDLLLPLAVHFPQRLNDLATVVRVADPSEDKLCSALVALVEQGDLDDRIWAEDARRALSRDAVSSLAMRTCYLPFRSLSPIEVGPRIRQIRNASEDDRVELVENYVDETLRAPNATDALLALTGEPELMAGADVEEQLCRAVRFDVLKPSHLGPWLETRDWNALRHPLDCVPPSEQPNLGWTLVARLDRDQADFATWAERNEETASDLLDGAADALAFGPAPENGLNQLHRLARAGNPRIAAFGLRALGRLGPAESVDRHLVLTRIAHSDPEVRVAAAETALALGLVDLAVETDPMARYAAFQLIARGIRDDFARTTDVVRDSRRGGDVIVTGTRPTLPPFPWPPPLYSHRVVFGQDVKLSLLGGPNTPLDAVRRRLVNALNQISPNFERGLFSAPGGYALITRLEQTNNAGWPLGGNARWMDVRPPPRSLRDYLARLFLAPPGHYRTIVFLFTNQPNFGASSQKLPDIRLGGTSLPDGIRGIRLGQVHAFALIYYFERRDGGYPHLNRLLGGTVHLERSGVAPRLGGP